MSDTIRAIGFAPGTAAIWAALVFGLASAAAYFRAMRLQTSSAPMIWTVRFDIRASSKETYGVIDFVKVDSPSARNARTTTAPIQ